jgi:hypothetical protein
MSDNILYKHNLGHGRDDEEATESDGSRGLKL